MYEDAMPHDAGVLREVLNDADLTPKRLALESGLHESTIYRYLSGEKTIPSIVLRRAFELTRDKRIPQLITGNVATQIILEIHAVETAAPTLRTPPVEQLLTEASAAVKCAAEGLPQIAQMLKDGKINEDDRAAIDAWLKHSADAQRHLAMVDASVHRLAPKPKGNGG